MGSSPGLQEVTYAVPADKCGLVIGKGTFKLISVVVVLCMYSLDYFVTDFIVSVSDMISFSLSERNTSP